MCLKKSSRFFLLLVAFSALAGCGALDAILPSSETYKINVKINNETFDNISVVSSKDKILPFFEEPVSADPDITELVVFLKDSRGIALGYKATYSLTYSDNNNNENKTELQKENNDVVTNEAGEIKEKTETPIIDIPANVNHVIKGREIFFPVYSLDETLPFFPLPSDLPIGKYTLVFQVMGTNTVLYKNEKSFFYLGSAEMSFVGIQVNLPGIAENSQFIQNGNVILLDAKINFDSRLDPYVVWYNGKRIIDEGRYSDGAGSLLWKAPDQNGFVSLRAEVFPSWEKTGLIGYQKGISILVSSKEIDMHLLSEDTPNLLQWYTFEGDLNDSISKDTEKKFIRPVENKEPEWLASNGTYGLASGDNITYKLPDISFSNKEKGVWQIISRFKPLGEGVLFSVQFGSNSDVTMTLSNNESHLILTLASSSKTYSETIKLPDNKDSFVTISVKFIIQAGRLSAKLAFVEPSSINQKETLIKPLIIAADLNKEFIISLGQQIKPPAEEDNAQTVTVQTPTFTALWDELAILHASDAESKSVKANTEINTVVKAEPAETLPLPVMTNPLYIE